MMDDNLFHSIYKVDGRYPDTYGVLNLLSKASEKEQEKLIKAIRASGLDVNKNIAKEVERIERRRDMLS